MDQDFENIIRILGDSIRSIDESAFNELTESCINVLKNDGRIIVSGLGKNVPVCEKFVGEMISLGLEANFMHTNSAIHGDLGMVRSQDLVILLSKSGNTGETVYLASLLKKRGCSIWLLTFEPESDLAKDLKKVIALSLEHEGDPWNVVPNHSTILNLIVLQELAIRLAKRMDVSLSAFKENHPGGAIGEKLRKGI